MGKEYLPVMVMINHPNTYDHKDAIKKYGGEWCSDSKRWWVPKSNLHLVMKVLNVVQEQPKVVEKEPEKKKRGRPRKIVGESNSKICSGSTGTSKESKDKCNAN